MDQLYLSERPLNTSKTTSQIRGSFVTSEHIINHKQVINPALALIISYGHLALVFRFKLRFTPVGLNSASAGVYFFLQVYMHLRNWKEFSMWLKINPVKAKKENKMWRCKNSHSIHKYHKPHALILSYHLKPSCVSSVVKADLQPPLLTLDPSCYQIDRLWLCG